MLRRLAFAAAQFHRLEDDLAFELLDLKFEVLLGALIGGALNDGGLQSLRLQQLRGQMMLLRLVVGENRQAFEDVDQFANIAREVIAHQTLAATGRQAQGRLAITVDAAEQDVDEKRQVIAMLAQWRDFHRQHGQAIVKIGTKFTGAHQVAQILVGGRDHLHLHGFAQGRADRLNGAVFEKLQQLGLYMQGDLADLVEEQRPPGGRLDVALLAALQRTGKSAALVAEHLRLEQALGNAPAVDMNERSITPAGRTVNVSGNGRLADAGLAQEQQSRAPAERAHAGVGDARQLRREVQGVVLRVAQALRFRRSIAE